MSEDNAGLISRAEFDRVVGEFRVEIEELKARLLYLERWKDDEDNRAQGDDL